MKPALLKFYVYNAVLTIGTVLESRSPEFNHLARLKLCFALKLPNEIWTGFLCFEQLLGKCVYIHPQQWSLNCWSSLEAQLQVLNELSGFSSFNSDFGWWHSWGTKILILFTLLLYHYVISPVFFFYLYTFPPFPPNLF